MRSYPLLCVLLVISLVLCPIAAVKPDESTQASKSVSGISGSADANDMVINVFASATGDIESVGLREYIIGSVASEMSPLYHSQALRAQAVACCTYALRIKLQQAASPDSSLKGADISDSCDMHQGYYTQAKRKELWGGKYEDYEKKIEEAVDDVMGYCIAYDGEPILAAYHAICGGCTQSAKSLWGQEIPYLVSVESPGDKLSPDYSKTVRLTQDEFAGFAKELGVTLDDDAKEWLGDSEYSDEGYLLSLEIGGTEHAASKIRDAFSLRSNWLSFKYDDGGFVIKSSGYGHGVGMSQYGADYMARQGSTWQEILSHYYPGTEIEKI